MDKLFIYLCLALAVFVCVHAQEPEAVSVEFSDLAPRQLQVGDSDISFICTVNRGLVFLMANTLKIIHVGLDGQEKVMCSGLSHIEANPLLYKFVILGSSTDPDQTTFKFTILTVRDEDQGSLKCQVNLIDADPLESTVDINLLRPMTELKMKVDAFPTLHITQQNPFEVDVGIYSVKCVTLGSNPAVDNLKLYVDNNVFTEAQLTPVHMQDAVPRFKVTLNADVDIKLDTKLECVAIQPFVVKGDTPDMMSISVPIKVNQYDPDVHCNTTEAYTGMMYPRLICFVDHKGLDIKEFKYFIKSTGQEIRVNEETPENINVKTEKLSPHKTKVIMDLYKADDWHFDTEFFLKVVNSNGQESQFPVKLNRIEVFDRSRGPRGSGSVVQASMTSLLLSVLITLLLQLK